VDVAAITQTMLGGKWSWLIVLGLFMVVSWIANMWARSAASPAIQYAGLSLYVVAQAILFVPLLFIASQFYEGVITTAAIATLSIFIGLTAFVFITGKDFSFLGGILAVAGIAALVTIGLAIFMGFELGLIFTVLMIALCGGYILYDTSNVMHHYRIGQHVAASLALFASVALLFWYMIRLLMILQRE
jgi:FtsH-binding integral membrane protein